MLKHKLIDKIQPLTIAVSVLVLSGCMKQAVEWKKFTYMGSGSYRGEILLPKGSKGGAFTVDHDIPITKADLKPLQMKWVHRKKGKNYTFSHYTGLFYSSGFMGPENSYAVYHKRTKEITWPVALQRAKKEALKRYRGRALSERPVVLNNKFQGIEVDFEQVKKKKTAHGKMRIFYIPKQKKRKVEYRIYVIQAIGDKEFLESEDTKKFFSSLIISA